MSTPHHPSRPLNLVIVDDDFDTVQLLVTFVQWHRPDAFEVVGFSDSIKAAAWMDIHCTDMLITDLRMPGLGGIELLKQAKRRNAWTQVILLTGASTLPAVEDALESDACEFLLKPVDLDELGRVLDQATERFSRWAVAMKETLHQQLA